jgi:hypothetical protein
VWFPAVDTAINCEGPSGKTKQHTQDTAHNHQVELNVSIGLYTALSGIPFRCGLQKVPYKFMCIKKLCQKGGSMYPPS